MKSLAVLVFAIVCGCSGGGNGDDYPVLTPTGPGGSRFGSMQGSGSGVSLPDAGTVIDAPPLDDAHPGRDAPIGHDGAVGFDSGFPGPGSGSGSGSGVVP